MDMASQKILFIVVLVFFMNEKLRVVIVFWYIVRIIQLKKVPVLRPSHADFFFTFGGHFSN